MKTWRTIGALILGLALPLGCSNKKDDGTTPMVEQKSLPPLSIREDTPDLMLTWIDEKGDTHVGLHPSEVPEASRSPVRVVVADKEDGTKDLFYVVDLSKKRDDGSFAAQTMSRRAWEGEIEKRREAYLAKVAPPPPPPALPSGHPKAGEPPPPEKIEPTPAGALTVIVYGASWCRPCHQAEAYLKSKGVRVVMKDIEETPGAQAEMRDKLEKSGQRGGSIPVIDVRGQILVGFSPGSVDRALAKAKSGTVL
jgi:glutaredoxin